MTDFTPQICKAAANLVAAQIKDGTFEGVELASGERETTAYGCIVRVTQWADFEGLGIRVIDASGRHWFPDVPA